MKKTLPVFLLFCFTCIHAFSRDTVINKYAAVLEKDLCNNILLVDDAIDFNAGDTVLMIQMKGAIIDTTNTASFGNVLDYRGAGNYELNIIKGKNGNNLTLTYPVRRRFDIPDGKVQIIRVPHYQNYTINDLHTCLPWNGSTGGVFIIDVANTLTMNAGIDVSTKGFRGGQPLRLTQYLCNKPDYFYPADNSGGNKAEGVSVISNGKMYGRGALANGGGGGNDHNAGGGGGANGGNGGNGGDQYPLPGSCPTNVSDVGGVGGKILPYSTMPDRLFLGGGGGSGHTNQQTDKPGGNGGGIIIIIAGALAGNNDSIKSNGGNVIECTGAVSGCADDGNSGGGAGGTVAMFVNTYTGNINVHTNGGKGADNWIIPGGIAPAGPGGGGSGGVVAFKQTTAPANVISTLSGGKNGISTQFGNVAWNSQPGQPGLTLNNVQLNYPADTFINQNIIDIKDSMISCFTYKLIIESMTTGITTWNWDLGNNTTSQQKEPVVTFGGYGIYTASLTAMDAAGCIHNGTITITISPIVIHAGNDTMICPHDMAQLHVSGNNLSAYNWKPDGTLSCNNCRNPVASPLTETIYVVTATDTNGCGGVDSVAVLIADSPEISLGADTELCPSQVVVLDADNTHATYLWHDGSTLSTYAVTAPGVYWVKVTSAYSCVNSDTIEFRPGELPKVALGQDTVVCEETPLVIKPIYSNNGDAFLWSNGSVERQISIVHGGVYTVNASNECGMASDTISIRQIFCDIWVPNAFTPDGDGLNDVLKTLGNISRLQSFTFSIYNRWGEQIFKTTNKYSGWDGTHKGNECALGTYVYMLQYNIDGKPELQKGNVTLLR